MNRTIPRCFAWMVLGLLLAGGGIGGCAAKTAKMKPRVNGPVITSVEPASVTQNYEVKVQLFGRNFDSQSLPTMDGVMIHNFKVISSGELIVTLRKDQVSTPGIRMMGVHDGDTGDEVPGPALTVTAGGRR